MHILNEDLVFPDVNFATPEGLLAVGGDLSVERLLLSYNSGIFPWYSYGDPILWWSPDPRMVLFPDKLKVSKSMRQLLKRKVFSVTYNKCFESVIQNCANVFRKDQEDTWITDEMISAYINLHEAGIAESVEVWEEDELVGGLYGINLKEKRVFCGESMFSFKSNASKFGFIHFVEQLKMKNYKIIDCQVHTNHLESLGAEEIDRDAFLSYL